MKQELSRMPNSRNPKYATLDRPIPARNGVVQWLIVNIPEDYNELDRKILETIASYIA